MKIKIVKKLSEKYTHSPSSSQSLEDLFKNLGVIERELDGLDVPQTDKILTNLFNNDLLFYDLETTGLSRKGLDENGDMIHQIAVLVYNSTQDFNTINPKSPDAAYVAKAKIPTELEQRTEQINTLRGEFLSNYIAQPGLFQDGEPFFEDQEKLLNDGTFSNNPDKKANGYIPEQVMGLFYYMFSNKKPKKDGTYTAKSSSEIKLLILYYAKQNVSIFINDNLKIKKDASATERDKFVEDFEEWLTSNKNIKKEELGNFFKSIFRPSITEPDIAEYFKNIGMSELSKKVANLMNKYERSYIGTTVQENKVFTHYDDFPLSQYRNPTNKNYINQSKKVANGDAEMPVSEKEALLGLASFVDKYPNGTLVGQNIISFDNPFVLARCEAYGINTEVFRNLDVYDARYFFSNVIKYLEVFKYLYSVFNNTKFVDYLPDHKKVEYTALRDEIFSNKKKQLEKPFVQTKEILLNLQKGGRAKGKLETLIKTFVGEDVEQTHTADDDCEKLAEVFIKSIKPFYDIYIKTIDFVTQADNNQVIQAIRYARSKLNLTIKQNYARKKGVRLKKSNFEKIDGPNLRDKVIKKMRFDWINYTDKRISDPSEKKVLELFINELESITRKTKDDKEKTTIKNKLDYLIQEVIQDKFVARNLTGAQKVFNYQQFMSLDEDKVGALLKPVTDAWNNYLQNNLRNQNNTSTPPAPPVVTESKRKINIKIIKG